MYRIRTSYSVQLLEPSEFGRLIRFLNWLRYWLETAIQWLALRAFLKHSPMDEAKKAEQRRLFWWGVKVERLQWRKLIPDGYRIARNQSFVEEPVERFSFPIPPKQEAKPLDVSRYVAPRRTKRHAFNEVPSLEDAFEPLNAGEADVIPIGSTNSSRTVSSSKENPGSSVRESAENGGEGQRASDSTGYGVGGASTEDAQSTAISGYFVATSSNSGTP